MVSIDLTVDLIRFGIGYQYSIKSDAMYINNCNTGRCSINGVADMFVNDTPVERKYYKVGDYSYCGGNSVRRGYKGTETRMSLFRKTCLIKRAIKSCDLMAL
jgi:hypothetical protein